MSPLNGVERRRRLALVVSVARLHDEVVAGAQSAAQARARVQIDFGAGPVEPRPLVGGLGVAALVVVAGQKRRRDALAPHRRQLGAEEVSAVRVDVQRVGEVLPAALAVDLVPVEDPGEFVRRTEAGGDLQVGLVAFDDVVEQLGLGVEALDVGHILAGAGDRHFDGRVAERAEEPDLVPQDRAAERRVELLETVLGRRASRRLEVVLAGRRLQLRVHGESGRRAGVVTVPLERLVGEPGRPLERVAAALGDDVDGQARPHRRRRVHAAGLHLGVLDHVRAHLHVGELEVVVVARLHPLELHDVGEVLGRVAEIHHTPAAIVERPGVDAGRLLEEVAPVAARRDRHVLLELAVDVQDVRRLGRLDHRRLARDRDRLLQGADLHRDVDLEGGACADRIPCRLKTAKPVSSAVIV